MRKPFGLGPAVAGLAIACFCLPASAAALGPADLSGLDCVQDNDTGTGGCALSGDGLDTPKEGAVSPDGRDVYVAGAVDDAVVQLRRDPGDGSLTPAGCIDDNDAPNGPDACALSTDGLDSVQSVRVTPDGRNVLAVSNAEDAIVNFTRDPATGALTPAGCIDDNDAPDGPDVCGVSMNGMDQATALAISPDGDDVYVAARSDDAIAQIRRDTTTGALTPASCTDDNDAPDGPDACGASTNGLADAQDVTVSPDGNSVYATSQDDDAIVTFTRNLVTGALSAPSCIDDNDVGEGADACTGSADAVNEPQDPVVSPDGRSVYLVAFGVGDQAVSRFDRAPGGGLTAAGCIANTPSGEPGCSQTNSRFTGVQGLAIAPDGSALYASSAGANAVASLRRSPGGAISSAGCVADAGVSGCPRQFNGVRTLRAVAVSPDGRDVYAFGDGDDSVAHLIGERPPACFDRTSAGLPGALQTVPLACSDPNGDPLTIEIARAPASGTLGAIDQTARTAPYTPNPGFSGLDGFEYRATADSAHSNLAAATLLVQPATGPQGPAGESAIKLIALLGLDKVKARAGRRVKFALGSTAPGTATLDVLKGSKVVASVKQSLSAAGRSTITWSGKGGAGKPKPIGPGKYSVRLTVVGTDGQRTTDSAALKLTKG